MTEEQKVMSEDCNASDTVDEVVDEAVSEAIDDAVKKIEKLAVPEGQEEVGPKLYHDDEEEVVVKIRVYYSKVNGAMLKVIALDQEDSTILDNIKAVGQEEYEFAFTLPDFARLNLYRRLSSEYIASADKTVVIRSRMWNYYILFHLTRTSFPLFDGDGKRVELVWEESDDGQKGLNELSMETFYRIRPMCIEKAITSYERIAGL